MSSDDAIAFLHRLHSVNRNAEAALRTAAETVGNSELATLFEGYAKQHAKFLTEIDHEVARLGGKPEHPAHGGSPLEKGWSDLKTIFTGHAPAALLSSCQDSELSAEVAYDDVLKANPTGKMESLVEKQREQVKGFRARLSHLVAETKNGLEFPKNA